MKSIAIIATLCVLCAFQQTQPASQPARPAPSWLAEYLRAVSARAQELKQRRLDYAREAAAMDDGIVTGGGKNAPPFKLVKKADGTLDYHFKSAGAKQDAIDGMKHRVADCDRYLKELADGEYFPSVEIDPRTMQVNQFGLFPMEVPIHGYLRAVEYRVQQVINADNMLIRPSMPNDDLCKAFWLKGLSTAGIVDDQLLNMKDFPCCVTGTKQYGTVLNSSRTVFVVETISPADYLPEIAATIAASRP